MCHAKKGVRAYFCVDSTKSDFIIHVKSLPSFTEARELKSELVSLAHDVDLNDVDFAAIGEEVLAEGTVDATTGGVQVVSLKHRCHLSKWLNTVRSSCRAHGF